MEQTRAERLIEMINNSDDKEKAAQAVIEIIIDFLNKSQ